MTTLRCELEKAAAEPLVMGSGATVSRAEICAVADQLTEELTATGLARLLVQTDEPGLLIASLLATIDRGTDVILASGSYGPEVRQEIVKELRVDGILESADPGQAYRLVQTSITDSRSTGHIYLLTSGTTGLPKLVEHRLSTLLRRALASVSKGAKRNGRWLLTYLPASFAGFQVVLTGAIRGTLVVPGERSAAGFVAAAHDRSVTHITATPTFWRSFLLANGGRPLNSLRQITLGGEATDQATLDRLSAVFPGVRISQVYGSTEGGFIFAVNDGRAGFPAEWLRGGLDDIQLRIRDGGLEVNTPLRMLKYAGRDRQPFSEANWLATGDLVEVRGDRVVFLGRSDDVINVGGAKLYPHEIEAFLLTIEGVREASVSARRSPISGEVVIADIVIAKDATPDAVKTEVMRRCREELSDFKVPRMIRVVESISVAVSGKKARN